MNMSAFTAAFGGFMAFTALAATMSSWLRAIIEVKRDPSNHPWRMVVLISLFNAGPWFLVTAALFLYFERSAPWLPWFVGGAAFQLLFFAALMIYARKRANRKRNAG
jgi:hypothetical protein